MTDKEVMQQALDALEAPHPGIRTDFSDAMIYREKVKTAIEALRTALRTALAQPERAECDGGLCGIGGYCNKCPKTQPEQAPVAWADRFDIDREGHNFWVTREHPAKNGVPLYIAPPQREWQGLTDEEVRKVSDDCAGVRDEIEFIRNIEAALKAKNDR